MEESEVKLRGEYIELNQLLKLQGLVASGGEAKLAVAAGMVAVDGEVENRTRRKLRSGSVVEMGEQRITIV